MNIETNRLLLRPWQESDRPAFAVMSADPIAMEYMGGVWPPGGSDHFIDRANKHFDEYGYGLYAVDLKKTKEFIGFIGIRHVPWEAHFTPAVEIGWRLSSAHWNHGYATEGAGKVMDYAFNTLDLAEIVSFTSPVNVRSWHVMEKLGMKTDPAENFRHPMIPENDILSEHVLYRLRKAQ